MTVVAESIPEALSLAEETAVRLPINAVERETGVSKELLRMWERRYGFPVPERDAQGDRIYPMPQVAKLRLLRRLIDFGFRPGKIILLNTEELERLLKSQGKASFDSSPELEQELLSTLKSRDLGQLRDYLSHQLIKMGLQSFVLDFLQYANFIVGDAWMRGLLEVHEEHLFTEQVQSLMRQAISNLREATQPPRVLLATPPEETHTLGILMVEAILRLDNVDAVCYGAQMPVRDVAQAVTRHKMHIVAISFSASYPTSKAIEYLEELRFRLPLSVQIWGGGASLRSTRKTVEAVRFFHDLPSIRQAINAWRREH
ncbi:MerR family transcriptional regulator [Perlucidibaca aquatica]|uniref:MerR family transcriptional regulator n=1 Tax=Perlucidibaca aquatica TaxID=1852776 RepID=UPI0009EEE8BD|nr:MerR family transcriptional regulator [Perlucidibaca aquatica]